MTYRVELTARAQRDLQAIYAYIHADSVAAAHRWFNGLEALLISLESQPERGSRTPEVPSVCQLLYGRKPVVYRILYSVRKRAGVVQVMHIRHGARQR